MMCNNIITKDPITPQVCRYTLPCEMSSDFKATIEIVLLHIFSWFWRWNNFENQLIFDEVKAYQKLCHFGATL